MPIQHFHNFIFEDHWPDFVNNYTQKEISRTIFSWHEHYGTNQLPRKRDMRVLLCKSAKHMCLRVTTCCYTHILLLLQTYGHYLSTTCFYTLSIGHLSMPNDGEDIQIIIYLMCQESNA